jgi:hypothetical protein
MVIGPNLHKRLDEAKKADEITPIFLIPYHIILHGFSISDKARTIITR